MSAPAAVVPDRFQIEAIEALDQGHSVLVAAPTGSGKTMVAEHAIARAICRGGKAFYTAPIKALSNQKFRNFREMYGPDRVGLLTGDHSINGDAPLVVMTTEVLRNMLYGGSPALVGLDCVILDEVHYLEDRYRGPVWEEVILNLPPAVSLVCLSATVSNSDELGEWLESVRGSFRRVVETERPVELTNFLLVGDRDSDRRHLVPVVVDGRPNRDGSRFDAAGPVLRRRGRARPDGRGGDDRDRRHVPWQTPRRLEVLDELERRSLLPAIVFVFSRAGCDDAARACHRSGVRFTEEGERARIEAIIADATRGVAAADLDVLGFDEWASILSSGIASHHAGLVPPFKDAVERAFTAGLVKVVFATETLALGINMPARSVVIERLTKFTGERHEFLTPGQYTQLTGRAGRRGLDAQGTAVVLWSPFVSFGQLAALVSSSRFELRSAFRPTYNMAANLVVRHDRAAAIDLLGRSFAQFQSDRGIGLTHVRLDRARRDLASMRQQLQGAERGVVPLGEPDRADAEEIAAIAGSLRPGDVIVIAHSRFAVLGVSRRRGGRTLLRLVDTSGSVHGIEASELEQLTEARGRVELPTPFAPHSASFASEVARRTRKARLRPAAPGARARSRTATVPSDPRRRVDAAVAAVERLERRVQSEAGSLVARFDTVLDLLATWGHVRAWSLTPRGDVLRRVYHESDLLIADAVVDGLLDGLAAPELAGVASLLTYEHRSSDPAPPPWYASRAMRGAAEALIGRGLRLQADESARGLPLTRLPDPTFAGHAHAWAAGAGLGDVTDEVVRAGDFVRNVRQLVDLLEQVADVSPVAATQATARETVERLDRGVVAAARALPDNHDDTAL